MPSHPSNSRQAGAWHSLRHYNLYRLLVAGLLLLSLFFPGTSQPLGAAHPGLFVMSTGIYTLLALAFLAMLYFRRPNFRQQLYLQTLMDILLISLLMHGSGGISSGLSLLLLVPVAAAGLLVQGRAAWVVTAAASMALIVEAGLGAAGAAEVFLSLASIAALIATAGLTRLFALRIQESETLTEQHRLELTRLTTLNEQIFTHLDTCIIVTDKQGRIQLINPPCRQMLGLAEQSAGTASILPEMLLTLLRQWLKDGSPTTEPLTLPGGAKALPRFSKLGRQGETHILIALEDDSQLHQQAQQSKLAALGRLSASIAHEIRNPLGAISHASQLLEESTTLEPADQRLSQIISEQSARMNRVIENVIQLSRRRQAAPEKLTLKTWLNDFIEDFAHLHDLETWQIHLRVQPDDLAAVMDPSHLQQVLGNLSENALSHGQSSSSQYQVEIHAHSEPASGETQLDVIDHGPGIDPAMTEQIFEPFYTTRTNGTGLGLYIAQELCELNQVRLDYLPNPGGGSCFRLRFSHTKMTSAQNR